MSRRERMGSERWGGKVELWGGGGGEGDDFPEYLVVFFFI